MSYYPAKSAANAVPGVIYPNQVIYNVVVSTLRNEFNTPFLNNASSQLSVNGQQTLANVTLASCGITTKSQLLRLLQALRHRFSDGIGIYNFPDVDQIWADDLNGGSIATTGLPSTLITINDVVNYCQTYF